MHPLIWFLALGLILTTKKATAAPLLPGPSALPPPPPLPHEGQIIVPIPSGWRRVTSAEVTPELAGMARQILADHGGNPYGTLIPFSSPGLVHDYAGLIEQHYHEPGGPVQPWGYHHGVTLLTRA
jgi:hypothetical protein